MLVLCCVLYIHYYCCILFSTDRQSAFLSSHTLMMGTSRSLFLLYACAVLHPLFALGLDGKRACSVEWMGRDGGDFLAVGTNHSAVQLWDASKLRQVRALPKLLYDS